MLVTADDLFKKIGYTKRQMSLERNGKEHKIITYWKNFTFGNNKYTKSINIDTEELTSNVTCFNIDTGEWSYRNEALNYTEQTVVCRKLKELIRKRGENK